ncbi:conserved hypothetical protein [Culex quinquefasciatus]|uniref:Uncharacterized protein n=1 Tax=Culex quinquefasciatus TaxID=7176 RepID=B0W949_CULQU|nr:conserved hypothetical protein [Culex quinquefasciatus]|eukprot:XP_001845233.1 conserved hypothetical protein [Culex quinquefasciatus]
MCFLLVRNNRPNQRNRPNFQKRLQHAGWPLRKRCSKTKPEGASVQSYLKDNLVTETFLLKNCTNSDELLPIKFISILPLLSRFLDATAGNPTRDNILRYCKYLLRKQEYEEVTWTDLLATIPAIRNPKTKLYDTIDRNDPVQLNEFRKLLSLLFESNASSASGKTAAARSLCQSMKNISDFVLL